MLRWGFPLLAKLKSLRGGPLDLFAHTADRRAARALLADYQAGLGRLLSGLTPERLPMAVKIASVPAAIRGYGHVKDAAMATAKQDSAALWAQLDALPSPLRGTVGDGGVSAEAPELGATVA